MKKMRRVRIFISLIYLFFAAFSVAAKLPKLPADPSVTKGVLPNGMSYYIVSNPSSKGMADFALVQRTGRVTSPDVRALALAKETLAELPMIGNGISPQKFFSSNGVNPTLDGFVKVDSQSTVYRFQDMLLSQNAASLDSALVVLVGMADKLAKSSGAGKWYSASDNAIIISGDVDSKAVIQNLKMLSYLTPSSSSQPRSSYTWVSNDTSSYHVQESPFPNLSEIKVVWRAPRVPDDYAGTLQPYIQKMFIAQLGEIAVSRMKEALNQEGISYASVDYRHLSSSDVSGDENFTVRMVVESKSCESAVAILARTMSALESAGAAEDELEVSRKAIISRLSEGILKPLKYNSHYVDKCIHSFLYGTAVVNEKEVLNAYTSHVVDMEKEQRLFRHLADALLDPRKDVTVSCKHSSGLAPSKLKEIFEKAWQAGVDGQLPQHFFVSDTLKHIVEAAKVSVKQTKKDPMSGGTIWTFSNGFKVIYKKMDTAGKLYWAMGLGGGFGSIPDLEAGEGAFVGDLLKLYRVAGMKGQDFLDYMQLCNIDMDVKVGLASTLIDGTANSENLKVLLRGLAAVANEREFDRQACEEYMRNEQLRLSASVGTREERRAVMDSLMCPDYKFSQNKSRGKIGSGLAEKADRFYEERFSAMNDGALVLVGDIDETALRKELLTQVGAFRTRKSAFYRPAVSYQPVSGWSTYTVPGNENSVYLAVSVQLPLTAENKMASEVAAMMLKKSLSAAIEPTGMFVNIYSNTRVSPQERFNVMISLKEASEDGFAQGVSHSGALEALRIVRSALHNLEAADVTDGLVKAYKEWLKNDITCRMKSPQYWINAISMRQLEGKDFTTDYKAKVDAVTTAKVKQVLASLNNASKVEYIISK